MCQVQRGFFFLLSYAVGCMSWETFIARVMPHSSSNGGRILPGLWQFTQEAASYQCHRECISVANVNLSQQRHPSPPPSSSSYIATFREILLDCTFFKLSSCGMFIEKIDIEYEKLILLWVTEYNIQYFRLCFWSAHQQVYVKLLYPPRRYNFQNTLGMCVLAHN